ncbi:MAG: tRNA uridine-5-carboxymethylaminomethyl(34) synthesis GTPase MnmE [Ignavibacteria bacterium]
MINLYDTICAISTPIGEGGISVIRISGTDSFKIVQNIFSKSREKSKALNISETKSHTVHFGYLFDENKLIDEVLVSIFKSPNSYTGEDVIEISAHGGVFVTRKILSLIIKQGARHAEPGEFSKRAFLNGKIDLSQAEAVADLIKSKTEEAHKSSLEQLEGSLSAYVKQIREDLINVTALVELELDFAEEDLEFAQKDEVKNKALRIINDLKEIVNSYIKGKVIRDGINVVIAGKPNSGKSSLFNSLLKTERAIVSEISGTTRDYLEENLIIDGILFNLTDTAGLRSTADIIEHEGIKRSFSRINDADLVIYLVDSSNSKSEREHSVKFFNEQIKSNNKLLVFTKKDLAGNSVPDTAVAVSISDNESLSKLKKEMVRMIKENESGIKSEIIVITNIRHKICLEKTIESLDNLVKSIEKKMSGEFLSIDLRNALSHLGEITGSVTNDDILTYVFSKFCIGK